MYPLQWRASFQTAEFCLALERHRCLFGFRSAHAVRKADGRGGRGLQFLMAVCCCCCCRKFPLVCFAPRPHILPPLFQCFRSKLSVTASKRAGRAERRRLKNPFFPSSSSSWPAFPLHCRPLVRSAASRAFTHRCR